MSIVAEGLGPVDGTLVWWTVPEPGEVERHEARIEDGKLAWYRLDGTPKTATLAAVLTAAAAHRAELRGVTGAVF